MNARADLVELVERSIRTRKLIAQGERVLVAVSGGLDSMVLLRVLHELAGAWGWNLVVAHLDHSLRGSRSKADEALVRKTCEELKITFRGERANVRQLARTGRISIEMAAREVRHQFLARVATEEGIQTAALAHHADDQVELFFLRILRGAGGEGLAGMKWSSPSPSNSALSLVRPLLNTPKSCLREFAAEQGIAYHEDHTNLENDYLRNRIRNELIPLLRRDYQARVDQTVLRMMEIVGTEAECVSESAANWLRNRVAPLRSRTESSLFPKPDFDQLSVAVQRQVLLKQLIELGIQPDFDLLEKLRVQPNGKVSCSKSTAILRDASGFLRRVVFGSAGFSPKEGAVFFQRRKGKGEFDGVQFQWQVTDVKGVERPGISSGKEFFDADLVGDAITLRHWRPGDRFQPIGMKSAVKLQDIFTNHKVLREERLRRVLAVTRKGEVFWVEGLRISERYKLTQTTERRLQWRWKRY